jgi:hypothetical protein
MQYPPQSCRKERKEKTMPINHTAIISINYTTQHDKTKYFPESKAAGA